MELARTGSTVAVPAGLSIIEALEAEGVYPDCSCMEGICGTCETTVLAGEPDHRDSILTKSERETGTTMFICVSRAKGRRLVLDL